MNNEPVAWIDKQELDWMKTHSLSEAVVINHKEDDDDVPLYTHPAKTLTDEEIIEVWGNIEETFNEEYDAKVFARAILRKAQEK